MKTQVFHLISLLVPSVIYFYSFNLQPADNYSPLTIYRVTEASIRWDRTRIAFGNNTVSWWYTVKKRTTFKFLGVVLVSYAIVDGMRKAGGGQRDKSR